VAKVKLPLFSIQASGKYGALSYNLNGFVYSRKYKKKSRPDTWSDLQTKYRKRFKILKAIKWKWIHHDWATEGIKLIRISNP